MGSNNTFASNPGRLPFSFAQHLKSHPVLFAAPPIMMVLFAILSLARQVPVWAGAGFGFIVGIAAIYSTAGNAKRQLKDGNLCAAQVVSIAPYTVAVLTDLCNDRSKQKLALKILKRPLQNMTGGAPKLNEKLAAVSFYYGPPGTGAWQDFSPLIANLACKDLAQIKRSVASIDPADWQIIQQAMKRLKPTDLGLHHLEV